MQIRRFDKTVDSFEDIIDLFKTGLGNTDVRHWKQKYITPTGFDSQIMYVIEDQNKFVAMMGFIPMDYSESNNKIYKMVQMCDLVVLPEYRGRGFFYKIYNYASEELTKLGYDALISFPNHNSLHGFEKMNYNIINMKTYSLKSNLKHMLMRKLNIQSKYKPNIRYTLSEKFSDKVYCIENKITNDSIRILLNKKYVDWRCEHLYSGKCKYIEVAKDKKTIAYFIILITKGRNFTAAKIVNFDFDKQYIKELPDIAKDVKNMIYSYADMIGFYGIWQSDIERFIINSFGVNEKKIKKGAEFILKTLGNSLIDIDKLFINHIDSDL